MYAEGEEGGGGGLNVVIHLPPPPSSPPFFPQRDFSSLISRFQMQASYDEAAADGSKPTALAWEVRKVSSTPSALRTPQHAAAAAASLATATSSPQQGLPHRLPAPLLIRTAASELSPELVSPVAPAHAATATAAAPSANSTVAAAGPPGAAFVSGDSSADDGTLDHRDFDGGSSPEPHWFASASSTPARSGAAAAHSADAAAGGMSLNSSMSDWGSIAPGGGWGWGVLGRLLVVCTVLTDLLPLLLIPSELGRCI